MICLYSYLSRQIELKHGCLPEPRRFHNETFFCSPSSFEFREKVKRELMRLGFSSDTLLRSISIHQTFATCPMIPMECSDDRCLAPFRINLLRLTPSYLQSNHLSFPALCVIDCMITPDHHSSRSQLPQSHLSTRLKQDSVLIGPLGLVRAFLVDLN